MLPQLNDCDWAEAFGFAGAKDSEYGAPYNHGAPRYAMPTGEFDCSPFCRDDVMFIHALVEGERDWSSWLIYGQLKDGRHFFIEAGCDYSGWD